MYSYLQLGLYLLAAECLRRVVLMLKLAYTGPLSKIPGPWFGRLTSIPWMVQNITGTSMNAIPGMFEKYGDVVRVGPNDILFGGKDAIQKILIEEDLVKSPIYESVRERKDVTSLFTETDKGVYKAKRRLLSPGFAISYINGLEPQMQECVKEFEKYLDVECAKAGEAFATINFSRVLSNLTFDVISATSLGGSFGLVASNDQKVKSVFMDRLKRAAIDANLPFVKYIPFIPSSMKEFDKMIDGIVSKRRAEMSAKAPIKRDLLQLLIDTNDSDPESFTYLHMREEMSLFMIAGSDTSSVTLTCTVLLLVNNVDKMKKLLEEVDNAFPGREDEITFAKTQELPYLNAVINESMRLMPIIRVGLARYTTQTTMISNYEIPPETIVSACLQQMLRSSAIWPDAHSFIPERWLGPYKGVEADRKAHLPFSAGSRNCIGQQFAMKELRIILATLVRRYELQLVEGQSHEMRVHTVPWFLQGYYDAGVRRRE